MQDSKINSALKVSRCEATGTGWRCVCGGLFVLLVCLFCFVLFVGT